MKEQIIFRSNRQIKRLYEHDDYSYLLRTLNLEKNFYKTVLYRVRYSKVGDLIVDGILGFYTQEFNCINSAHNHARRKFKNKL